MSATAIEGGRVVGVWKHGCRGKKIAVTVEPFRPIPASTRTAIEREARALARYLGGEPELEIVG